MKLCRSPQTHARAAMCETLPTVAEEMHFLLEAAEILRLRFDVKRQA